MLLIPIARICCKIAHLSLLSHVLGANKLTVVCMLSSVIGDSHGGCCMLLGPAAVPSGGRRAHHQPQPDFHGDASQTQRPHGQSGQQAGSQ